MVISARGLVCICVILAGVADSRADAEDWRAVIALPPAQGDEGNAWIRWQREFGKTSITGGAMPDAVIAALAVREGEHVGLPRPVGPEAAVAGLDLVQRIAQEKHARVESHWRAGQHEQAVDAAVELVCAGADMADDACSLPGFLAGLAVTDRGIDAAEWILSQPDVESEARALILNAVERVPGAMFAGVENVLRGEYALVFRVVLERMPDTRDPQLMLARFSTFGLAVDGLGVRTVNALPEIDNVLLDVEATLEVYGRALADFIEAQRVDRAWKPGRFDRVWRSRIEVYARELGAFARLAFEAEDQLAIPEERGEIVRILTDVGNPFGKLYLVMMAVDADGVARAGFRVSDRAAALRGQAVD